MTSRPIPNWSAIKALCRSHFPEAGDRASEDVHVLEVARCMAEDAVRGFDAEGAVGEAALVEVVEEAARLAAEQAVAEIHDDAAKEAVAAVAKEAASAALHEIRHEAAMETLHEVAATAARNAVRELRHGTLAKDDATAEEVRVARTAMIASAMGVIIDGEVEEEEADDMPQEEEEVDSPLAFAPCSSRRPRGPGHLGPLAARAARRSQAKARARRGQEERRALTLALAVVEEVAEGAVDAADAAAAQAAASEAAAREAAASQDADAKVLAMAQAAALQMATQEEDALQLRALE
jgi:hypothetical protein